MRALLMTLVLTALAGGAPPAPAHAQLAGVSPDLALGIRQVEEGELETAVATLGSVVGVLSGERGREKDLSVAHLYLSMAHLGLSEWEIAKANMRLAWKNDRGLRLDPKQFPPRLLQLYEDIKREAGEPSVAPASAGAPADASPRRKGANMALVVGAGVGGAAIAGGVVALAGRDSTQATVTTLPARRTDTFPFTLSRANLGGSVMVGPVHARAGMLTVTLAFAGDYVILACVGTASSCRPMGGRPQTQSYDIPGDFPVGPIQAEVYFNRSASQPPGDPSGTVSFTYDPQ